MKLLLIALTIAAACIYRADVKRLKYLEGIKGLEYIDVERFLEDRTIVSISIQDLVKASPPTKGVARLVRVIELEPGEKERVQRISSYRLKHVDGTYEFQVFPGHALVEVKSNHSVVYYTGD